MGRRGPPLVLCTGQSVEPGIAPKSGHPGSAESTQSGKSVMALDYHVYHTKIHSTESYIQFN